MNDQYDPESVAPTSAPESSTESAAPSDLPDLPEPFAAGPVSPKLPSAGGSGCTKVGLLGCGVLILLFGLGMMVLMFKANDLMSWVFGKLEAEIERGLPADLTPAERERLDQAFTAFYAALESGEIDPSALQRLQGKLMELSADIESGLTREQVNDLSRSLEGVAGLESAPGPADEAPSEEAPSEEVAPDDPVSTVWFDPLGAARAA